MPLQLDNLRRSVVVLAELIEVSEDDARMGQLSEVERNGIRSGVIQNFEVTYELSCKLMACWLNTYIGSGVADLKKKRELFRLAAESGLIPNVDQWMQQSRCEE